MVLKMLSPIQFEIVERKGRRMLIRKQNPWFVRRRRNGLSTILCKYQC
jgi:ribosomal protein L36